MFLDRSLPVLRRLKALDKEVMPRLTYGCESWAPPRQAQSDADFTYFSMAAKVIKLQKNVSETWIEFKVRGIRHARNTLQLHNLRLPSTFVVRRRWRYGLRVASFKESTTMLRRALEWHSLTDWNRNRCEPIHSRKGPHIRWKTEICHFWWPAAIKGQHSAEWLDLWMEGDGIGAYWATFEKEFVDAYKLRRRVHRLKNSGGESFYEQLVDLATEAEEYSQEMDEIHALQDLPH